jgi:hypothetical protein
LQTNILDSAAPVRANSILPPLFQQSLTTVGMIEMRRISTALAMAGVLTLGNAQAALAAPPPPNPTPIQCLEAFDNIDEDYVGDGWVGAQVAGPTGVSFVSFLFEGVSGGFNLFCGDELSGVVHIGHGEGSGSGHAITPDNERYFVDCWRNTIAHGRARPDHPQRGRTTFIYRFRDDQYATAVVDSARRFT